MKLGPMQRGSVLRLMFVGGFITFLLGVYTFHPSSPSLKRLKSSLAQLEETEQISPGGCSPEAWSGGQWRRREVLRTTKDKAETVQDVLEFEGFQGCASDREFRWHIGGENEDFARYPEIAAYDWVPPADQCQARRFNPEEVVRDMAEQGGWLLIGDSVTEGHFFSLSCLLFPHVRATPNYTENPYWDRAWPQNLYLNPNSPLVSYLRLPDGFDIHATPLVTFRRVDLLLNQDHLREIYARSHPNKASQPGFELLGGDLVWEVAPDEYMRIFTSPLPEANYGTMIVSTAGHWTVGTFPGLEDSRMPGSGIQNVVDFFGETMQVWADLVRGYMSSVAEVHPDKKRGGGTKTKSGRERQILVRAYLPGHDGCHDYHSPWTMYEQENMQLSYNWGQISTMNQLFQRVISPAEYNNIHYLGIDRPGLLRPDGHVSSDCLHLMTGPGVLEGWSQYIWHFITREIGAS